jgi:hypothetical protein
MAKTYNTIPTTTTGSVYTAAAHNNIVTNVNNYRVPPACQVRRTTNLTSYTSDAAITWESAAFDTESPSDPMWAASPNPTRVTIKTAGLYVVSLTGKADATATLTLANANISVNGNLVAGQFCSVLAAITSRFAISVVLNLAASDFITAAVGLVGGSAYIITGSATAQDSTQTRLTVSWLGQAS